MLLATETLTLLDNHIATEFISGVGGEVVQYEPSPVELVGKVEEYLAKALNGITLTLQVSLGVTVRSVPPSTCPDPGLVHRVSVLAVAACHEDVVQAVRSQSSGLAAG